MTSGLRSVRDKAITYFDEWMADREEHYDRLFKVVNVFAEQIRRVAAEDKQPLEESGLNFNIHALVGGRMKADQEHKLYLIYPQGNWVEVGKGTPYYIIGASGYGKPVLDRTLKYGDPMAHAMKVGYLAFDSTRISAADVDFPVDVVVYSRDQCRIIEHRFEKEDVMELSHWWQERLRTSLTELPAAWVDQILGKLNE